MSDITFHKEFPLYVPWVPVRLYCAQIIAVQYDIQTDKNFVRVKEWHAAIDVSGAESSREIHVGDILCVTEFGQMRISAPNWIRDNYQMVAPEEKP